MSSLTNKELEDIVNRIAVFQNCGAFHPLTCGNNSNHSVLQGRIVEDKVILFCPDCDYTQASYPMPSEQMIKDIETDPFYQAMIKHKKG